MRGLLVAVVLAAGCASAGPSADPSALPGPLVSTEYLAGRLGEEGLLVVQVSKDRAAYDAGHVPGAVFLPYGSLSVARDGVKGMLPDRGALQELLEVNGILGTGRVVFYDDDGGAFAARAWMAMDLFGEAENAALLDGQWAKWRAEGRPVETAPAEAAPFNYVCKWGGDPARVADLGAVAALVAEREADPSAVAFLDARPAAEFSGEKPGEDIARPGHIPGAASLPWTRLVESEENPVLRSPGEIRALLDAAGAREGTPIVAYCRTGRQASLLYFAARLVGRPVRLYDGSFLEWQADPARPVER